MSLQCSTSTSTSSKWCIYLWASEQCPCWCTLRDWNELPKAPCNRAFEEVYRWRQGQRRQRITVRKVILMHCCAMSRLSILSEFLFTSLPVVLIFVQVLSASTAVSCMVPSKFTLLFEIPAIIRIINSRQAPLCWIVIPFYSWWIYTIFVCWFCIGHKAIILLHLHKTSSGRRSSVLIKNCCFVFARLFW